MRKIQYILETEKVTTDYSFYNTKQYLLLYVLFLFSESNEHVLLTHCLHMQHSIAFVLTLFLQFFPHG